MAGTFGSNKKERYMMQPWEHSMEQRFVKPLVIFKMFSTFKKL